MKYNYKAGMCTHKLSWNSFTVSVVCELSHAVAHVEFTIVLLNMYGEYACRATVGEAFLIAYSVLCLTYAAVRYSFLSTHRSDRIRCVRMATYWLNVITFSICCATTGLGNMCIVFF